MTTAVEPNTLNYAFDPYGNSPANKIVDEYHIITPDNSRKFNLLIPLKAPFFATGFQATLTSGGTPVPLLEGVHFQFAFEHMSASRKCSKPIYGAIIFIDETLSGTIRIDQYQTLGGVWTLDEAGIAEIMANTIYNPRTTTWEKINGLPYQFPTIDHEHNVEDLGMGSVVDKLDEIKQVLATGGSGGGSLPTLEQLGLDQVPNLPLADDPTATAALSRLHLMSPMGVRLAIMALIRSDFDAYVARRDNPNQVTAAQVGAYSWPQVDSLLNGYLAIDGKAVDTELFDGKTPAQYMAQVLAGTAANSNLLAGLTVEQLSAAILMGTAANSMLIDGLTVEQLIQQVSLSADSTTYLAGQIRFVESSNAPNQPEYLLIADGRENDGLELQDGFLLIVGGNKRETENTPMWLLRYSNNGTAGVISGSYGVEVCELTNTGLPVEFGVLVDTTTNPADPAIEIWMKGVSPMDEVIVTSLTRDALTLNYNAASIFTLTAPVGATWVPPVRGIWNAQKLNGQTAAQIIAAALAGTAANALLFDGLDPAEFATAVLLGKAATAGTADNALALGGQTPEAYTLESELITALGQLKTYIEANPV